MVTACLVLAAVMAGLAQTAPAQDPLSAALTASEQALMAAQGASPGSPTSMAQLQARSADLHRVIAELDPHLLSDPAVRRRLEVLLADQHQALVLLARHTPVAVGLLIDLQRLAAGLDLRLPTPVVPSPSALSADPSLLPDTHLDDALEDRLPGGPIGTTAGELVTPTPTGPIEAPVPATPPGTVAEEAPPPGEAGQASTTADPPPAAEEPTDAPDSGAENPVVEEEGAPQDDGDASMPADIEALLEEEATVGVATGGVSDLPGLPGG